MTTTSLDIDDELLSRCIVLAVDESPEQTRLVKAVSTRAGDYKLLEARAARVQAELDRRRGK